MQSQGTGRTGERAHDMVCVDECSGNASVRATLAGLSLALEPEPAHGLGFAQVVRASWRIASAPGSDQNFSLPFTRRLIILYPERG